MRFKTGKTTYKLPYNEGVRSVFVKAGKFRRRLQQVPVYGNFPQPPNEIVGIPAFFKALGDKLVIYPSPDKSYYAEVYINLIKQI